MKTNTKTNNEANTESINVISDYISSVTLNLSRKNWYFKGYDRNIPSLFTIIHANRNLAETFT